MKNSFAAFFGASAVLLGALMPLSAAAWAYGPGYGMDDYGYMNSGYSYIMYPMYYPYAPYTAYPYDTLADGYGYGPSYSGYTPNYYGYTMAPSYDYYAYPSYASYSPMVYVWNY